ncbi:MAG: hypothetical protein ABL966_03215 [Acidimicrobiales bacterium]
MTLTELAVVVVAVASVAAVALLTVAVVAITRLLREVREVAATPRADAAPVVLELGASARRAGLELEPVDVTPKRVPRMTYVPFASPIIKVMAMASGTGRAARSFRRERGR